jgi:dTDP-4-dehydrorhamnose reductase
MQIVVAGASGYLGKELIRQSLYLPKITSVIALARRQVDLPDGLGSDADPSKLQSVVLKNYYEYPEEILKQFASVDGCIW